MENGLTAGVAPLSNHNFFPTFGKGEFYVKDPKAFSIENLYQIVFIYFFHDISGNAISGKRFSRTQKAPSQRPNMKDVLVLNDIDGKCIVSLSDMCTILWRKHIARFPHPYFYYQNCSSKSSSVRSVSKISFTFIKNKLKHFVKSFHTVGI